MTVAVDLNREELNANGSLTAFDFNFAYSEADQIKVYVVDANDNASLKALNTDYTLSATSGSSGRVTFGTAPAATTKVLILRQAPFTQGVDYQNNDALDAETLEGAFDKLTFQTQQLKAQVERSVRFDETLTGSNDPIINIAPTTRAGKLLSFDANGAFTVSQEVGVFRGDYATGVAYNARDIVKANNTHSSVEDNIYFCIDAVSTSENTGYTILNNTSKFALLIDAVSASASATAAAASATAAASSLTSFNDIYLGAATSAPSTSQDGALWFDTQNNQLKVYDANSSPAAFIAIPTSTHISTVATNITNVNTVGAAIANVNTVAGNSTNINTVAGISANVTIVAGDSSEIGTVAGISSNVTTVAGNNTNITTVAGINADVTTVAGISSNVTSVAGNTTNINTVASNVSGVNSFAERYRVQSGEPTTSLNSGDLVFDTTAGQLKVYNGSAWEIGVTAGSGNLQAANNLSDVANTATARSNLGITDESIAFSIALG